MVSSLNCFAKRSVKKKLKTTSWDFFGKSWPDLCFGYAKSLRINS